MSDPQSPRAWLCWAVSVSDRYASPHSPKYDFTGKTDPRVSDRRERAIDVKMALDRATDGNGVGELLMQFYVGEVSWGSFTPTEQWHLSRAIRRFREELTRNGFLPEEDRGL